jgi:hypothetical protein
LQAPYRVRAHVSNGYKYASTQPSFIDQETGKRTHRCFHWGTVDEKLKFHPGNRFFVASPEERARLIFPDDWDMSEAEQFTGLRHAGRPSYCGQCQNRLYGDIWLLEQVAIKTGIRQDLAVVFNGNLELVDDILTLAMFPYLTGDTYNHVADWQEIGRAPSSRVLTPSVITRLTQTITGQHRMRLFELRAARTGKDELCAVDSTSRSAYGTGLADIQWGKNKEGLPLPQTTEVVVYSLSNHMPIFYRTFPGNIPDSRTIDAILADLNHAGFKKLVLITDRGYESVRNLEKYILQGQAMIMATKTSQGEALKEIEKLVQSGNVTNSMTFGCSREIYHKQHEIEYMVKSAGTAVKSARRLKLNLYYDIKRMASEWVKTDLELAEQNNYLEELVMSKSIIDDISGLRRSNCYYKIAYDEDSKTIKSFERNDRKVARARMLAGFFSIMTHKVGFDAMTAHNSYRLRDEQEKCFQLMKDQMVSDRQRNSSEGGKTGRLFILFVSLILGSHVRHVWGSTKLRELFDSSLKMLRAMKPIRYVEHPGHAKMVTPFVGKQLDVCEAFGFEVPEGCAPTYTSRQQPKRKRGRPPKKKVSIGF